MSNLTKDFYNNNADNFAEGTLNIDFSNVQQRFLRYLKPQSYILDMGCGAGRDSRDFIAAGYKVDAIDGSEKLCKIASETAGIEVKCMNFDELNEHNKYDGIWASASILHVPTVELSSILKKMCEAVKKRGYIYISFKYGDFEGERNGRFFNYMNEDKFADSIGMIKDVQIIEEWKSQDVRDGRGGEAWYNVVLQTDGLEQR